MSRLGAPRERDARGGVLVRFEERDAETKGRQVLGCIVGVVEDDGRAGTHQLAGDLLSRWCLELVLRELLVALQASQPLHRLRGVMYVARGLHWGSRR